MTRLDQLLQLFQEDKNDPFIVYGIALEYVKTDSIKANEWFTTLLNNFPDYLPTYYHAAHFFVENNDPSKAIETFQKGIMLAQKQGDLKTLAELKNALLNLELEL
jgi:Tfp pilus assembly protein PilF